MQEKWYKVLRANIDPRTADKRPHRHYSHLNLYCICITLWAGGNSSCYNCLHDLRESSEVILTETEVQEDSAQEKKKSSESFSSEGTRRWHETSEQLWPWLLRCLCRLMQSRRRRRRHQASPHSILESDGQVSVRVIKAGGTTEGILNIKHFTLPSLGIEKSLSLYKVCTLPLLHHNLLLCRLFINTVFPPFPHISAQIMHNFSIKLLKTVSVRLQMRAVRFSLHDYRCWTNPP